MTEESKLQIEWVAMRHIVTYLLARDYAQHRQPLDLVWTSWLGPLLKPAVQSRGGPDAQAGLQYMEQWSTDLLQQAEQLAKQRMGANLPPPAG